MIVIHYEEYCICPMCLHKEVIKKFEDEYEDKMICPSCNYTWYI